MALPKRTEKYTYLDYLSWPDNEPYELIDGQPYAMSPAPSRIHQEICGEIFYLIKNYLRNKSCKVYTAPFDVRLMKLESSDKEIYNVVQPDITLICNPEILDEKGAKGIPTMIVEIVSPSSSFLDYVKKLNLYGDYGVPEYWIIDPKKKLVFVYTIDANGQYGAPNIYNENCTIAVGVLENLEIDLTHIFSLI